MPTLFFGQLFEQRAAFPTWRSQWFTYGTGNIAGLWMSPYRNLEPANWDKVGYGHLAIKAQPTQVDFRINSEIILYERRVLFMFPTNLSPNEFRLELDLVDWIRSVSVEYGTVTL